MRPPEQITVRQLLQHRSGMPDYVILIFQQGAARAGPPPGSGSGNLPRALSTQIQTTSPSE
jgi:CubicO group peptidase (beta-lactamase class C family)